MNTNKVKSITELSARGVRAMMGVREETVIVKDQAASRGAALEGIAAVVAFLVNIRQELCDCVLNRICTAERADDAVLCGRVSLLFSKSVKRLGPS